MASRGHVVPRVLARSRAGDLAGSRTGDGVEKRRGRSRDTPLRVSSQPSGERALAADAEPIAEEFGEARFADARDGSLDVVLDAMNAHEFLDVVEHAE